MEPRSFEKMYLLQLQDLYSAAKQLIENIPKLTLTVNNRELKHFLRNLHEKNKLDFIKIEEVLKKYKNFNPHADNCDIVEEFLEEADEWLEVTSNNSLVNAGLILLSKKISHYHMAVLENIISCAKVLSYEKPAETFTECLNEWVYINIKLNEIFEASAELIAKS